MNKREYEEWYQSCEFIRHEMQFFSWRDLLENLETIKFYYDRAPWKIKYMYSWYVYSSSLSFERKNALWDYLNDCLSLPELKISK